MSSKISDCNRNLTKRESPEKSPKVPKRSRQCRICLAEENSPTDNNNDKNNEMIRPCVCSGTIAYVHQSCLIDYFEVSIFGIEFYGRNKRFL